MASVRRGGSPLRAHLPQPPGGGRGASRGSRDYPMIPRTTVAHLPPLVYASVTLTLFGSFLITIRLSRLSCSKSPTQVHGDARMQYQARKRDLIAAVKARRSSQTILDKVSHNRGIDTLIAMHDDVAK